MKRLVCFFLCLLLCSMQMETIKAEKTLEVNSEFVYIYNVDSEKVLYEKHADEKMYPASLTKIMTTLVAIEEIADLDEQYTLNDQVFTTLLEENASIIGYQPGDVVSIRDLLYGTMLCSGADAARALAIRIAGSEDDFAQKMNDKAVNIGMTNTHFVNCTGLHEDAHYSTAKDLAILLQAALQNETFQAIFAAERYDAAPTKSHPNGITMISTRLKLEEAAGIQEDFITGSKTGFTLEAGACLASTATDGQAHYLMITGNAGKDIGTYQHIEDTYALYQSIFATYTRKLLYAKDEEMWQADIRLGKQDTISLAPQEDIYVFMKKTEENVTVTFDQEDLQAPIEAGYVVGNIHLQYQGEEVAVFPVYALTTVEANMWKLVGYWSMQVVKVIGLMILFAFGVIMLSEGKKRLLEKRKKG